MGKLKITLMKHLENEPRAVLSFGDVTISIPYTLIRSITMDNRSMAKDVAMFSAGVDQIFMDMNLAMGDEGQRYHRDTEEFKRLPFSHNPLHEWNEEVEITEEERT